MNYYMRDFAKSCESWITPVALFVALWYIRLTAILFLVMCFALVYVAFETNFWAGVVTGIIMGGLSVFWLSQCRDPKTKGIYRG